MHRRWLNGRMLSVGFNLALLVYADTLPLDLSCPVEDAAGSDDVVRTLFPRTPHSDLGTASLSEGGFPERGRSNLAMFERGLVLATRDAALFNPTKLHPRYLKSSRHPAVALLTQQSVHDMFAYARWQDGELVRSISVNPVGGVWENVGRPDSFELPFWDGRHPAGSDYPLPFHPLDMSDAALRSLLRLHFEGPPEDGLIDPSTVTLHTYERADR